MTPEFDAYNDNHDPATTGREDLPVGTRQTIQRDRFELLSAYLDGEVTAAERRQVEEWLANDPTVQRLHARLLKLRQGFSSLPTPTPEHSVQQTVDQVFAKVERRSHLRLVWGGAAIAALFTGALLTGLPFGQSPLPQMAQSPEERATTSQPNPSSEPLLIALDQPLVPIPKAPISAPTSANPRSGLPTSSHQDIR